MSTDRVGGSGIVRRHKATHATGGTDALTPADIGAAATDDVIANALVNDAGDLLVGSANDTVGRLGLGSDGQVLTVDTSGSGVNKVKWADASGGYEANRNLIINGAMQVAQRGTSATALALGPGYYTADRWVSQGWTGMEYTQSNEADAPSGSGLSKSLKVLCTTAQSPSATNWATVSQRFEGQDLQRIKKGTASAEALTLSFWVKSNVTGTFTIEVLDGDNSRHVSFSYSIGSADTWEYKTIAIPADTTGALDDDNAASFFVFFTLGAGSNRTSGTLASTWASRTTANIAAGQTNLFAATNNYWQVTGVQLETGPVATPFEFEPYEATLRKCQRYYYVHADGIYKVVGMAAIYDATKLWMTVSFPVPMRTAPTANNTTGGSYFAAYRNGTNDVFNSLTVGSATTNYAAWLTNDTEISSTAGHAAYVQTNNSAARVAFSAEL